MSAQMSAICSDCIEDEYLQRIVEETGNQIQCSECGSTEFLAFTATELGELIGPILIEQLSRGEDIRVFHGPDDEKGGWEQEGESLDHYVQDVLKQYPSFYDEILEAVYNSENVWPPDGEQAFLDEFSNYVTRPIITAEYLEQWRAVELEIRHRKRFFSITAKSFFDSLFHDIDSLRLSHWGTEAKQGVVKILTTGTHIFRSRKCVSTELLNRAYTNPMAEIGPPPIEKTSAGRMNSDGIVVFYGALEADTAIAELRPSIGGDIMSASFETQRDLRLLDFKILESAISTEKLSYFDPEFESKVSRIEFLRQLHALISKPVQPGQEHEYLITQTMAEYLNHVIEPCFDGLIFKSVQKQDGLNVTLFPADDGSFPISYVDDSFRVTTTDAVQYKTRDHHLVEREDGVSLTGYWFDWY